MMFQKAAVKRWRRVCHKELDRLGVSTPERAVGLVVMSVYAFGTDVDTLSEISGQAPADVRVVLKRLRQQRILVGQVLRVNWNEDGLDGLVALCCDLLVASGTVHRPIDQKRSAALKGKAGRKRGGKNRPRTTLPPGAVYTPAVRPVPNQFYQITEQGRAEVEQARSSQDLPHA